MKKQNASDAHPAARDKSANASSSPTTKTWWLQGLTLAVLLGAFALFFLVYAPSRSEYLTNRSFRLLGDISRQTSDTVVYLNAVVTNAVGALSLTNSDAEADRFASIESKLVDVVPHIKLKNGSIKSITNGMIFAVGVGLERAAQSESLILTYSSDLNCTNSINSASSNSTIFTARVDLRELLRPVLARSDFGDVLVVKSNGDVVFQLTQTQDPATNSAAASELRIIQLPEISNEFKTNPPARGTFLREKLEVAGVSYKLFAQPLTISVSSEPCGTLECWLCGLVRLKDFEAATWEIPTTTTIAFIFTAFGLFFLWPFLNIIFCGPNGEVRRWEVFWLMAASFFGCATMVFGLLYSCAYLSSEQRSDDELDKLAAQVQTNLLSELKFANQLLGKLDNALYEAADRQNSTNWSDEVYLRTNVFIQPGMLECATNYPTILDVFWVDTNGMQVAKWTPTPNPTAIISVEDRGYFRSLLGQWAWSWSAFTTEPPPQSPAERSDLFYLDSVFSKTRGQNEAAFARTFSITNKWPSSPGTQTVHYVEKPFASVITLRPLSLFSPLLPAGYGFCIVDGTGQVLFHSDFHRNLRENFITEAGGNHIITAAIYSRTHDHDDVRYYNRTHHVCAIPAKGLPWIIVAFRNEQVLDGVHRNVLWAAGALYATYLGAALLILLPALFLIPRRRGGCLGWLWPDAGRTPGLSWRSWMIGIGVFIALASVVLLNTPSILGLWLFFPLLFLTAICWIPERLIPKRTRPEGPSDTPVPSSRQEALPASFPLHRRNLALLLILFAMVPAFACFKLAFTSEMAAYMKGTQLKLARDMQQRGLNSLMRARKTANKAEEGWQQRVREYRAQTQLNRYLDFFFDMKTNAVEIASTNADRTSWFEDLYSACRPHFDEADLRTAGLERPAAYDTSWHSSHTNGLLILTLEGRNGVGSLGSVGLTSTVPRLSWLNPWSFEKIEPELAWYLLWYLCVVAAICAPFVISWFITRHLLLFGIPRSLPFRPGSRNLCLRHGLPSFDSSKIEDSFTSIESTRIEALGSAEEEKETCRGDDVWRLPESSSEEASLRPDHKRRTITALVKAPDDGVEERCTVYLEHAEEHRTASNSAEQLDYRDRIRFAQALSEAYREVWKHCTPREQLTLFQVARSGFATDNRLELRTLLDRGLLQFRPALALRNESFRRFVLATFDPKDIEKLAPAESQIALLGWRSLRAPIGIAMTAGAMFLFATQRELWQLAIGMAGSFATASQGLSKITSIFAKSSDKTEDPSETD